MEKLNAIVKWIPFPTAVNILAMMATFFVVMMKQPVHLLMMANKQFGIRPHHIVNQCAITLKNPKEGPMNVTAMRLDLNVSFHVIAKHPELTVNQVLFAKKTSSEKPIGPAKEPPVFVSYLLSTGSSHRK